MGVGMGVGTRAGQWPRWLPLYAVLVLAATLSPLWTTCDTQSLTLGFYPLDFALNGLLFAPLGVALVRWPSWAAAVAALAFSVAIEWTQSQLPRIPNLADIAANTGGALIGYRLADRLVALVRAALCRRCRRTLVALAAAALWAAIVAGSAVQAPPDLSSWKPRRLAVGGPIPGEQPWHGEIAQWLVFDRALAPEAASRWLDPAARATRREGAPVLELRFTAPASARVAAPDGWRSFPLPAAFPDGIALGATGLRAAGGAWLLPEAVSREIHARIVASGEFTLAVRMRAADGSRASPQAQARVLSLARDPVRHSFTLEQFGHDLALRVRTPARERLSWEAEARTSGGVLGDDFADAVGVFRPGLARIFVDAVCRGEIFYPLVYQAWPFGGGIAFTIALGTLLPALAAAAFAATTRGRRIAGGLAGSAAWIGMGWSGAWAHFSGFDVRAALVGAAVLLALAPLAAREAGAPPSGRSDP